MTLRAPLTALSLPARRWSARLAALFVLWAVGLELATRAGFVAAVATAPGTLLLSLAGLSAIVAAFGALGAQGRRGSRAARALTLAGTGLLLLSPPLSLQLRETRMLKVGEGMRLPAGALPGLPALQVGPFSLAHEGPFFPLSKSVEVPLETEAGESLRVGLFPPTRLAGWRLAVFEFGYAPAVEWRDADGREIAAGLMMLGTFPKTEEEARLVDWLPEPNVMMGVGTFPPKVEDLLTPPGTDRHLHVRLQSAVISGVRRTLAAPEAYRWVMDGRPEAPALLLQAFEGSRREFEGLVRGGERVRFPGGELYVGPELALWADVQAVRDPFVELFLAGGLLLSAGALAALVSLVARALTGRWDRAGRASAAS